MYNIAICDDNQSYIELLKEIIYKAGLNDYETRFYEYNSGSDIFEIIEGDIEFDLIILDIQLDKENGSEIARKLRNNNINSTLVFCSGVFQPSPEMIKVNPYRFLLKEYSNDRMIEEMKEIVSYIKEIKKYPILIGKDRNGNLRISIDKVLYISIARRGSLLHLFPGIVNSDVIFCQKSVKELYESLDEYNFAYAHNSYIVNLKYIRRRNNTEIELMNGEVLTVSRARSKELRDKLMKYMEKKYL